MMAGDFDPTTAPAYQQGAAMSGTPAGTTLVRDQTHEEIVRSRLAWIQAGIWVIAGGVILNFVSGFIIGFAASYR
ncbi:hypothetical protein E3O53_08010 [Cryobacterium sp. TMT2-18-3]|uniref:hypothetical protein n=1 Tax=unclassified Cryobacterium TaxID=2649013 RepID=UPI001069926A|nr:MULTISPECIES: hypothetical protein [unclassified Cryobacterium]TFC26408.1 hypothetical protein E3O22_12295 [Cryobacterium sp. TMT2-18-2]TFC64413.1 hypothetical protein E3O53_08010 [Cryobacterium sp. TMT2-18-3]